VADLNNKASLIFACQLCRAFKLSRTLMQAQCIRFTSTCTVMYMTPPSCSQAKLVDLVTVHVHMCILDLIASHPVVERPLKSEYFGG
jgi:hypothetical protein